MDKDLLQKLKDWRARRARQENVELFRVISNQAVEEIASRKPQSEKELLEIKGIKEKKFARYGGDILGIIRGDSFDEGSTFVKTNVDPSRVYEVGEYLDVINNIITGIGARIKGEISSLKYWPSGASFDLKDKKDESLLKCFIWKNDYEIGGVEIKDGMEIMVWGYPEIRKQWGQLNFQTKLIELVGEGALKKAFEDLKRKLEKEGLFAIERKKHIPQFVKKVGLITSSRGEAIIDYRSNLGKYGIETKFYDVRVEGKQSVFELIASVRWFNENMPDLDVLAIVKGGGSLESFQAFNTEAFAREVAGSKIPTICGVGHERDVTLVSLAADKMVSTPTAVAKELSKPWDEAGYQIDRAEKNIFGIFEGILANKRAEVRNSEEFLLGQLSRILGRFRRVKENIERNLVKIRMKIDYDKSYIKKSAKNLVFGYVRILERYKIRLKTLAEKLVLHDPERQLKLGYSLVKLNNKIIRSVREVKIGDEVDIKVSDGELKTEIKKII
ncbi:MAG: exodeoxyribonuclease VII large subunit [Candidatus Moranbacteria bacterium]|nr:exodeoxyribonuclease VII large subunit [Candidatus Moranbacteria bacterium]